MKKSIKTLVLFIGLTSLIAACGKDDSASPNDTTGGDNNNPPAVEDPEFSMLLNFNKKQGKNYKAVFKNGGVTISGDIGNFSEQLVILQASGQTTGTYVTKEGGDNYIEYVNVYSTIYAGGDGKIVISKIDKENKTVSGTFNAILHEDGKTDKNFITEGKFVKIPYTEE